MVWDLKKRGENEGEEEEEKEEDEEEGGGKEVLKKSRKWAGGRSQLKVEEGSWPAVSQASGPIRESAGGGGGGASWTGQLHLLSVTG